VTVHPTVADAAVAPAGDPWHNREALARRAGQPSGRRAPGATALFEVSFAGAMSDLDLALLERELDLWTDARPKLRPRSDSPGFVRLDHYSGLFLERGPAEGRWMLRARTWGHPAAESVHAWHLSAARAAQQLDPTVIPPERLSASSPQIVHRPVGRAANKRLARIRRRMVGLP
jgi:hypothetical protein